MSESFDRDLFVLVHDVARLIRVEADKRARVFGMTRAQWGLLLRLERHPGLTQKEVADLLEVEPISVARLVDRLEANGLIERCPDAGDRRVWRLHLRPGAAEVLSRIKLQKDELQEAVGRGVSQEMREVMVAALQRMKANLLRPNLLLPQAPDIDLEESA